MKVLLVGGTGVLSSAIAKKSCEAGLDTYILNRGNKTSKYVKKENTILADVRDVETTKKSLGDMVFDVVIDFVSFNVSHLKKTTTIFQDKCKQYIFISSATVYDRSSKKDILTEDYPITNTIWDYASKKAECEQYLEQNAKNLPFEYTIVRPYLTYGETRIPCPVNSRINQYTLIYRLAHDKPIIMWDDGNAECTLTHTDDFSDAILGLMLNGKAYGQAFHIVSEEHLKWKEIISLYASKVGKTPDIIFLPSKVIEEEFPEIEHELTGDKGTSFVFDNSKIKSISNGAHFNTPFSDGIERTFKYYREHETQWKPDYIWDAKIDSMIKKYTDRNPHYIPYTENSTIFDHLKYCINRHKWSSSVFLTIAKYKRVITYRIKKYLRFKKK